MLPRLRRQTSYRESVPTDLHRNAVIVRDAARARGVDIDVRSFDQGARTALDAAAAVGVEVGQIVKSLIFAVGEATTQLGAEVVLAMVSGANNLDERKLAAAAGTSRAWRVDADVVRAATGFAVGGVAPVGHPSVLRTWIDEDLLQFSEVWAAAGTPECVFAIAPEQLVSITDARVADLAKRRTDQGSTP